MKTVTIDRKHWWRGHTSGTENVPLSMLLGDGTTVPSDQMCCLGHVSLACGLTKDEIRGKAAPYSVIRENPDAEQKLTGLFIHRNGILDHSIACLAMMKVNDNNTITDDLREARLKEAAMGIGYNLEFV